QFNYDVESSKEYTEARFKETLKALTQVGLIKPINEETIAKLSQIKAKMNSIHRQCTSKVEEDIEKIETFDTFGKQEAFEIACTISLNDVQYEEMMKLDKEFREVLKLYSI
ncbi:hypothetical protein JW865_08930, partial [Candidatus Bathyarchaeota archaeon]|nr:hypothetical protein [Candidatus Bathyarchaeota archaeon]